MPEQSTKSPEEELQEKYNSIMDKISDLHAEAGDIRLRLFEICKHRNFVAKRKHYEGGYFDRAETVYWNECTICGRHFNEQTKVFNYG